MLWAKHVRDYDELVRIFESVAASEIVRLLVDGRVGDWKKANNNVDSPTGHALIPLGEAAVLLRKLYDDRRGE